MAKPASPSTVNGEALVNPITVENAVSPGIANVEKRPARSPRGSITASPGIANVDKRPARSPRGSITAKPVDPQLSKESTVVKSEKKNGKGPPGVEPKWTIAEFIQDANWFASNFGIPNEGETPHKIVDVSEEQLARCFGDRSRNGYKLSNCIQIPHEVILALTQVVDGFDKPVNGVLSLTFVKGLYVEQLLKRKVNWAAYAATKLKGQLVQWEREGKGRPDGPPCVRKPRLYQPPSPSEGREQVTNVKPEEVVVAKTAVMSKPLVLSSDLSLVCNNDAGTLPTDLFELPKSSVKGSTVSSFPNVLLSIVETEAKKLMNHKAELSAHLSKIDRSTAKLQNFQRDSAAVDSKLAEQVKGLELDIQNFGCQIAAEDQIIEELTTEIELENNKVGEDTLGEQSKEMVTYLEEKMKNHKAAIEQITSRQRDSMLHLETTHQLRAKKRAKLLDVPTTLSRLTGLSVAFQSEQVNIDQILSTQNMELSILNQVLLKPCHVLNPTFTLGSAQPTVTPFSISPCPVCCNGYHRFNWIPASCGHTYHHACLFPLLINSEEAPQCIACGDVFSCEWMHTWGLECSWDIIGTESESASHETIATQLKDMYVKNSKCLQQRRIRVQAMNSEVHAKGDVHVEAEEWLASGQPSSIVDEAEDEGQSSKNPMLLTPKVEGDDTGKKRKADLVDPVKKVKGHTVADLENGICFTPSATLPFLPETMIIFKPYPTIKSPCTDGPSLDHRETNCHVAKTRLPL